MRWEWDVDGQIVSAELNLLTGRETIAVDGAPAFDKISWSCRNEVPTDLRDGREAKVVISARWGFFPRCVLVMQDVEVDPRVRGSFRQIPWWGKSVILASVVLVAAGIGYLSVWPSIHWIRGGWDVPPPRWTQADLHPVLQEENNTWHLIGHSGDLPPFNLDRLLLGSEPIPAAAIDAVDGALRQPRVAELLYRASAIQTTPALASPHDRGTFMGDDILRLPGWHDWVLVSVKRKIQVEPTTAANELAELIPMWIQCVNLARDALTGFACAVQARRDLELSIELAKLVVERDARARLTTSIRDAPRLSAENVIIAEYVTAYRGLESYRANGESVFLLGTDLKRTLADIDDEFASVIAGNTCEERKPTQWSYNWGGQAVARSLTVTLCVFAPRQLKVAAQVSELRAQALAALSEAPK
jgi:hypothetical protein